METILQTINAARLKNKNQWYFLNLQWQGKTIQVKGFNTWLQVFSIDGINHSNSMDQSVNDFKAHIINSLMAA